MLSCLTASVLRDLSFRTRLGRRPHTINTDSLASLHSTQLARLTLTFFFPRSTKCNRDAVSSLIVGGARIQADKWLRTSSPTTSIPRKTFTGGARARQQRASRRAHVARHGPIRERRPQSSWAAPTKALLPSDFGSESLCKFRLHRGHAPKHNWLPSL